MKSAAFFTPLGPSLRWDDELDRVGLPLAGADFCGRANTGANAAVAGFYLYLRKF
jgi:hypothetical protein